MHILSPVTALFEPAEEETEVCGRDRISNPGPQALESDALPTAVRGPAKRLKRKLSIKIITVSFRYLKIAAHIKVLGPVVQSFVSLTSSLRRQLVKCFKTL